MIFRVETELRYWTIRPLAGWSLFVIVRDLALDIDQPQPSAMLLLSTVSIKSSTLLSISSSMAGTLQRKKGGECVAVVKSALDDISKGQVENASTKLRRLREDSDRLVAEAERLVKRLEKVETHYIHQEERVQKEIGKLGCLELDLKREKSSREAELDGNQSILRDNQSKLSSAENEVEDAKRKLEQARANEAENVGDGALWGALLLGIPTLGLGALPGAALGASIGAIINACEKEESQAKDRLERRKSDYGRARSAVEESKRQVCNIQSQISNLQTKIGALKTERLSYHKKIDEMKQGIILAKKSIEFWGLFKQASEHGSGRTSLLKKIVDKASEKGDYRSLHSGSSRRLATTFMEAWEEMEDLAVEGRSSHILQIEFKCAYCGGNHTALPYVDKRNRFVCAQCSPQYAIQN